MENISDSGSIFSGSIPYRTIVAKTFFSTSRNRFIFDSVKNGFRLKFTKVLTLPCDWAIFLSNIGGGDGKGWNLRIEGSVILYLCFQWLRC